VRISVDQPRTHGSTPELVAIKGDDIVEMSHTRKVNSCLIRTDACQENWPKSGAMGIDLRGLYAALRVQ
jgi:hypothetical protein